MVVVYPQWVVGRINYRVQHYGAVPPPMANVVKGFGKDWYMKPSFRHPPAMERNGVSLNTYLVCREGQQRIGGVNNIHQ